MKVVNLVPCLAFFTRVVDAFTLIPASTVRNHHTSFDYQNFHGSTTIFAGGNEDAEWNGEVVSNSDDGTIKGCSITQVAGSLTLWTISIDGEEADLGKFSEAIYKKIISDAKQQRFQGFRPGTIPPHLQPTYYTFSMDEAAREATLEAMEQNQVRPFENARSEFLIESVSIPPPKLKKKKKKGGRRKKGTAEKPVDEEPPAEENAVWMTYPTMKEAISAGWKPGQSFSFIAKNVKGQKVEGKATISPQTSPVGAGGAAFDLNKVAAEVASGTWKEE